MAACWSGRGPAIADNPDFTRLTDVAVDAEGSVWVVNRHNRPGFSGLFVFSPATNRWETVPYFAGAHNLDRLALDDFGGAWVSETRQGGAGQEREAERLV